MAGAAAPPPPRRGGGDDRYRGGVGLAGGRRGVVRPHRARGAPPPARRTPSPRLLNPSLLRNISSHPIPIFRPVKIVCPTEKNTAEYGHGIEFHDSKHAKHTQQFTCSEKNMQCNNQQMPASKGSRQGSQKQKSHQKIINRNDL